MSNNKDDSTNNFGTGFVEIVENQPLAAILSDHNLQRSKFKYFAFVEGFVDKEVYPVIIKKKLNLSDDVGSIICGKKNRVFKTLINFITESKIDFSRQFYIVDHDYDELNKFDDIYNKYKEKNNLRANPDVFKKNIIVTKYYAIENYIFVKENLEKVYDYMYLSDEEIDQFKNNLNEFYNYIIDFEVIKYMETNNMIEDTFKKKYFEELNIDISNNGNLLIDSKLTNDVNKKISNFTEEQKLKFDEIKSKLSSVLYIKGHDIELYFDLMMKYFDSRNRFSFKKNQYEMNEFMKHPLSSLLKDQRFIKNLNIEIDIKKWR